MPDDTDDVVWRACAHSVFRDDCLACLRGLVLRTQAENERLRAENTALRGS